MVTEGLGGSTTDVPLGQLEIVADGAAAQASLAFTLPADTPPGEYWVVACNEPCTTGFGDLIGSVLYIGVEPPATDASVATIDPPPTTVQTAMATATASGSAPQRTGPTIDFALPPYSPRSTGLDLAWVGISAGFGGAVLLLAISVRRRSESGYRRTLSRD